MLKEREKERSESSEKQESNSVERYDGYEAMQKFFVLKGTCKRTLRQLVFCLRPLPFLDFCLGVVRNFVGSESGHIQSVKLLQNMVSNTPSQPHNFCIYFDTGGGGVTGNNAADHILE
jgi:hypothetical protein